MIEAIFTLGGATVLGDDIRRADGDLMYRQFNNSLRF